MGDSKSKFPDFQEILGMGKKLYSDIKKSFCEIINNYKEKKTHEAEAPKAEAAKPKEKTEAAPKATKKPAPKAEKESKKSGE